MANTLNLVRDGASLLANAFGVGFIDWLDATLATLASRGEAPALGVASASGRASVYMVDRDTK